MPDHAYTAALRAFWLDHDWLSDHPDETEYVRRRIPYEFGADDDLLLDPDFEMQDVVGWVLVRRMPSGRLGWLRVPLEQSFPQPDSAGGDEFWQWNVGRPSA